MLVLSLSISFVFTACQGANNTSDDSPDTSDNSSGTVLNSSDKADGQSLEADGIGQYASTLYTKESEDFVILNLTDFQLHDGKSTFTTFSVIDGLVNEYKPSLITVLGDTAEDDGTYGTKVNFKAIVDHIDALGIPWAPVFGNHDNESYREPGSVKDSDNKWIIETFSSAKNCLFKVGPTDVRGNGNYIVNIVDKSTNKIVKSLFFFDSGTQGVDRSHVGFYEDALAYCKDLNGGNTPESIVYMHIPLPEYMTVYQSGDYVGIAGEKPCIGNSTPAFFVKIKELGSTTHVVCGHDHINSFYSEYQGVFLMYALKSSDGDYYDSLQLGGMAFKLGKETTFEYRFMDIPSEVVTGKTVILEHLENWKNSNETLCFDIKPTDTVNGSNKAEINLFGDNLRRTGVDEATKNGEWNRLSETITLNFANMTASCGTFVQKSDGWYTFRLDLSKVHLNSSAGEVAYGDETLKLMYINNVGRSFMMKKVYYDYN